MDDLELDGDENPFTSRADKAIVDTDVPERLQIKLDKTELDEVQLLEEVNWIIYRLTTMPGNLSDRYSPLAGPAYENGIPKILDVLK